MTAIALARTSIAHHSKSFALASRILDARTRDRTALLYAYCRRVDDAIDHAPPGEAPLALAALEAELAEAPPPILQAIPRRYPEELLAGMAMDASETRYTTLVELHRYCFRVAGVVGLMMCHVFGVRDDAALVPAARLGVAMQLTNICRDVAEDWRRGRLYLPDELLAHHGAGGLAAELAGPLPPAARPALARSVRDLLALADGHYRAADRGIAALPWRAGIAVRAARRIYAAIGDRIAATGFDVTAPRAVVPRRAKLALAGRAITAGLVTLPARALARRPRLPTRVLEVGDVPLA